MTVRLSLTGSNWGNRWSGLTLEITVKGTPDSRWPQLIGRLVTCPHFMVTVIHGKYCRQCLTFLLMVRLCRFTGPPLGCLLIPRGGGRTHCPSCRPGLPGFPPLFAVLFTRLSPGCRGPLFIGHWVRLRWGWFQHFLTWCPFPPFIRCRFRCRLICWNRRTQTECRRLKPVTVSR